MAKPILFLDIDGVICTLRYGIAAHGHGFVIDPVACMLVERVRKLADAEIVVSSTWRASVATKDVLHNFGIRRLHDDWRTPDLRATTTSRGCEVDAWLRAHPGVERFAALDDEGPGDEAPDYVKAAWCLADNLFDGIGYEHAFRAAQLLTGEQRPRLGVPA